MYPSNMFPELALRRSARRNQVAVVAGVSYFAGIVTFLGFLALLLA